MPKLDEENEINWPVFKANACLGWKAWIATLNIQKHLKYKKNYFWYR